VNGISPMPLINKDALKHRIGEYYTGKSDALSDKTILQRVRMRRRQLGQMTMALDRELARRIHLSCIQRR